VIDVMGVSRVFRLFVFRCGVPILIMIGQFVVQLYLPTLTEPRRSGLRSAIVGGSERRRSAIEKAQGSTMQKFPPSADVCEPPIVL
jgi:hypothetical protein